MHWISLKKSKKPSTSQYLCRWVMLLAKTKQNRDFNCRLLGTDEHASIDFSFLPCNFRTFRMHALLAVEILLMKAALTLLANRTALRACRYLPSFTIAFQGQYHYAQAHARTLGRSVFGTKEQDRFERG